MSKPRSFESTPTERPRRGDEPSPTSTLDEPAGGESVATVGARPAGPSAPRLATGTSLGRYLIIGVVGEGGMGTVYEAYDPTLDRRVAIKVVAVGGAHRATAERRSQRLLREAQALARLSHRNVVGVYDVGHCELGVFLALELVAGETLAAWLVAHPRSLREVLAVFAAAGRGLQAAHEVGILHRDFKPQNVVVGRDGQPRVLDFGLARAAVDATGEPDSSVVSDTPAPGDAGETAEAPGAGGESSASGQRSLALSEQMTQAGALMGTPHFMAPEQYQGLPASERSDQFSFCVALYEALYGTGTFRGATGPDLARELAAGKLAPAPAGKPVPPHVRRALLRGLSIDPAARFGTMAALLAELARDPGARLRRAATTLALAAGVAAGTLLLATADDRNAALCVPPPDALAGVWDAPQRAAVESAFAATGKDYAAGQFARTDAALADYRHRWRASYTAACEATQLRGEQSAARLDQRMACLRRDRERMAALVAVLGRPDADDAMNRALDAVAALGRLDACSDDAALAAAAPATAPAQAASVAELWRRLDRAEALEQAGAYGEAMSVATAARAAADALEAPGVQAAAWLRVGSLQDRVGEWTKATDTLERAAQLAAHADDRRTLATAWLQLQWVVGYQQKQFAVAQRLRGPVEVAVYQAGSPPMLRQQLLNQLGMLAYEAGDLAAARERFREFHAFVVAELGAEHSLVASALNNIAMSYQDEGNFVEAEALFRTVIELERDRLGEQHPWAAHTRNNLAETLRGLGRFAEAERLLRPSVAIYADAYGEDSPRHAGVLRGLGVSIAGQGERDDEAEALLTRSLETFVASLGPEHAHVADTHTQLAAFYLARGRLEAAEQHYRAAVAALEAHDGQERWLGEARVGLARIERRRGRVERAEAELDAAALLFEASLGAAHPAYAEIWLERGRCELLRGHREPAAELFERAVAQLAAAVSPSAALADARFELARVLAADPPRARQLALAARAWYALAGATRVELATIDAWLAAAPP